jgi:hypothetical protein
MRTCADRLQQIEGLLDLVGHLEMEPHASVRLETDLLIAYSLARIERHLSELIEKERDPLAPQRRV